MKITEEKYHDLTAEDGMELTDDIECDECLETKTCVDFNDDRTYNAVVLVCEECLKKALALFDKQSN